MSATVTTRGTASVPAQPDEVEISLEIAYVDRTADAALTEAAARSETLGALFSELQIGRERWTTSGVSVREHSEWDRTRGEHVARGYIATNRLILRLPDSSLLGTLMNEATRRSKVRIDGPWWRIAPDNPAHVAACRAAALDARRKAEGYAAALDLRLGAVTEITEPGIPSGPQRQMKEGRALMSVAMDAAPEMEVHAGSLDVTASVIVTFALEAM
jgi:uncharacterized protein YggE